MTLRLHPLTLKEARNFVGQYHRHHKPPQGGLFAIGVAKENDDYPSGVVIVGRPVARMLDDVGQRKLLGFVPMVRKMLVLFCIPLLGGPAARWDTACL